METTIENTPQAWSARAVAPAAWDACMWSEQGQTTRFIAVLRHLQLRDGDGLLDYGCGTGRLCEFLPRTVDYFGFDWADGMRERARVDHPRAAVLDEMPAFPFDHVVAVGPFNLAHDWSAEKSYAVIRDLWAHTLHTLVVSLYRGDDPMCLSYAPAVVAKWAGELTDHFHVDAHLPNDVLLVAHR